MRGIQLWFGFGAKAVVAVEPTEEVRTEVVVAVEAVGLVDAERSMQELAVQGAEGLGLSRLARELRVVWNSRMRSTAGRAFWPEAVIELNPALKGIGVGEVERTLLHELAHLVAFERAGRRRIQPHGEEWRRACAELGIPGEGASHRLELPSRTMRRKWVYRCPHCLVEVERVRRMSRYSACWPCCRKFSASEYDERFLFEERRLAD